MSSPQPLSLLREVSRSFYRTLRVLPGPIRTQISQAYLLARTTDTIADTQLVPVERRLEVLELLRRRILSSTLTPLNLGELVRHQGSKAEMLLLENAESSVRLLETFSATD